MLPIQFGINSVLASYVDGAARGLVGLQENPVTPGRLVGIALVALGVVLVRVF